MAEEAETSPEMAEQEQESSPETEQNKEEVHAGANLTERDLESIKTVYVKNSEFPPDYTDQQLNDLFKDCGTIVSAALKRRSDNDLRGYGFVEFETHEAAKKAVETKNNILVGEGRLGVVLSTSEGPKEKKVHREFGEGKTLFVRQLNYKVRGRQLKEAFAGHGNITSCRVSRKGYGFVEFENLEDAIKAKAELDGMELQGKPIAILYAEPRPEREAQEQTGENESTPEKTTRNKRRRNRRRNRARNEEDVTEKQDEGDEQKRERKPKPNNKIFLKNLIEEGQETTLVTEEDVVALLQAFGEVERVTKITPKDDQGTFIYVTMADDDGAAKAEAAGEGEMNGATFQITWPPRPRRRYRGRRRKNQQSEESHAETQV